MKVYNPDNPFAQPEALEQLTFLVNIEQLMQLEFAFEEVAFSFSSTAAEDREGMHMVQILCDAKDAAAGLAQTDLQPTKREAMEERDWVSEVQADFKPMRAGTFYVYGSHITQPPPHGTIPIIMDAGAAFGTGEHATTSGCLALLSRQKNRPNRVLDLGCGTGILAIAAAKKFPSARIIASDYCATAVRVTRANLQQNRVGHRVHCAVADGMHHALLQANAPYDLVLANILAGPLVEMAGDIARSMAQGGTLILSGLLTRQERKILAAYESRGFKLMDRLCADDWSALLLRKGAKKSRLR